MADAEAKVALVTGSSSGIGEAVVKRFSQEGYKVVITGSRQEKVDRVADICAKLSPQKFQPLSLVLDFSSPDNGAVAVQKTIERFGRLDVLVNNAGIFVRSDCNPTAETFQAYRQVMTVNIDASVSATLAAAAYLKETKGNIIFVSSVASIKQAQHGYAYCMSKAAMSSFGKSMAIELAPDVRVNIVSPGPVATPIFERVGMTQDMASVLMSPATLQNRVASPEEVADSIFFLSSEKASFITGLEMFVDGGYAIKPNYMDADQTIVRYKQAQAAKASQEAAK